MTALLGGEQGRRRAGAKSLLRLFTKKGMTSSPCIFRLTFGGNCDRLQ